MEVLSESQRKKCTEILEVCVALQLRKASRLVTQLYNERLRGIGVRSTQVPILLTLALTESAPITLLAQQLVMDRTTLGQNLKPLQTEGLIEVAPGEDRRKREVRLTDAGRALIATAVPLWEQAQDRVIRSLGQEHLSSLQKTVAALLLLER